jgi:molybdate transport repressor ModE-like protein
MKTGAVILAAGIPSNITDYDPTIKMGDTSAIKKIIITLQKSDVEPIVVVTGYRADILEKHAARMGVAFLRNDEFIRSDMFHGVCTGIKCLKDECGQIFIIPADIPFFASTSLELLINGTASAVCPVFDGRPGHPILLRKNLFEEILNYKGGNGLWGAVTSGGHTVEYIDVDDEGVLLELDSREVLERFLKSPLKYREPLRFTLQLKIGRNQLVFGPGILQFLELVNRSGSMQTACRQMHISYSKGLKMIGLAEKETGLALLERHAGGVEGGASFLTPEGKKFIDSYSRMQDELETHAEKLFQQYFGDNRRPV